MVIYRLLLATSYRAPTVREGAKKKDDRINQDRYIKSIGWVLRIRENVRSTRSTGRTDDRRSFIFTRLHALIRCCVLITP
jgi:hypothetical protein